MENQRITGIGFSPELIRRARQNISERSAALILESRELIERSRTLLLECQQQQSEPRFTYRREHLKLLSWQSSAPCCLPSSQGEK
jgi:hypothetical protein